jgi:hypothetical protein
MGLTSSGLPLIGVTSAWLTPLWTVAVGAAVSLAVLLAAAVLLRVAAPRVAAIAQTTAKEGVFQPLFWVLLVVGIVLLVLFPYVCANTMGEDIKVLKTDGLTLIKILAIVLALWTASISISDEIEGRTALTLLSKPVRRWQLILGKFLGILALVAILFIILGAIFLATVSYKVAYDARENALPEPEAAECWKQMLQVSPGLAVSFMEAMILVSVSVAISTRLPVIPNLMICASIYVLGHLVSMVLNSPAGEFPLVHFTGRLIAAVLPVLDHFNMESLISTEHQLPLSYLLLVGAYSLLYSTVAMLVALLLFEDRDLA